MKQLQWTFKGNELLNDIEGIAYNEGYVMKDDADAAKHSIQDIMAEGNIELVIRSMDTAFANVLDLMHSYTATEVTTSANKDNTLVDAAKFDGYKVTVNVPDHFSTSTQEKAVMLIHDYLVKSGLAGYLNAISPQISVKYHEECNAIGEELAKTMNKRTRPVRIKQNPSGGGGSHGDV